MQKIIREILQRNNKKILLIVLDGLGGLPVKGKTELEVAKKPNLDALAKKSACGLHIPIAMGITPGSGPGHFSLFGYDPFEWEIGRGVLEALGLWIELKKTDVAIRANYATIKNGIIKDRRAGRISTEENKKLAKKLQEKIRKIDNVEVIFAPGMEYRSAIVLRFPKPLPEGAASIKDTDPQKVGNPPVSVTPKTSQARSVAKVVNKLIAGVTDILKNEPKANYMLLRGFSQVPDIPRFEEVFGLKAICVAVYPMYRGLARLVGMDAPALTGDISEEIDFLKKHYRDYDFFFLHIKKIDSYGEDGNFKGKVEKIEEFDSALPRILDLNPDVLIITGDHSTPSVMKSHSWHPVPILMKSPYVLGATCKAFTERECIKGELGIFPTINLMPLALANAGRLKKFGA